MKSLSSAKREMEDLFHKREQVLTKAANIYAEVSISKDTNIAKSNIHSTLLKDFSPEEQVIILETAISIINNYYAGQPVKQQKSNNTSKYWTN